MTKAKINWSTAVSTAAIIPVLTVPMAKEGEQTVAWAVKRPNGGRGFGFTGGHFFDNWRNDSFRKMALNGDIPGVIKASW